MPLDRLDLTIDRSPLCFAHLHYVDAKGETVHEQLVDHDALGDGGELAFNIGELRPLDGAIYGIVEIYAHRFDPAGDETQLDDPEGVALALLITLARVDVATVSDARASIPTP